MLARSASATVLMIAAISAPSLAMAQEAESKSSSKIFADILADAAKPKPKAPAADFGKAAAACAAALGPTSMDATKVESLGWSPIAKASTSGSVWIFEQKPSPVRIFLATMFSPSGQCVVDGYAMSENEFGAIAKDVKKQVSTALGKKLKDTGSSSSPGGYSRGQGFLADNLMVGISSENQPGGMSIRVTMMQIDKSKSAYETANAAGMAAEYLPMLAGKPEPEKKAEESSAESPQSPQ